MWLQGIISAESYSSTLRLSISASMTSLGTWIPRMLRQVPLLTAAAAIDRCMLCQCGDAFAATTHTSSFRCKGTPALGCSESASAHDVQVPMKSPSAPSATC